jgi:prevent-host-death family protein
VRRFTVAADWRIVRTMDSVTLQEARERLEELAERVAAGERVVVTKDGKPVFQMTPANEPPKRGGFDEAALERFKKERGIDRIFTWGLAGFRRSTARGLPSSAVARHAIG